MGVACGLDKFPESQSEELNQDGNSALKTYRDIKYFSVPTVIPDIISEEASIYFRERVSSVLKEYGNTCLLLCESDEVRQEVEFNQEVVKRISEWTVGLYGKRKRPVRAAGCELIS